MIYDLTVTQQLWRYDRALPSPYALAQNFALLIPTVTIFALGLYAGFNVVATRAGSLAAWAYAVLVSAVMAVGVVSFMWARIRRKSSIPPGER